MPFVLAAGAVPPFLPQLVALVAAAAAVAYACQRLGLVPIVGFLLAGVLIGPHALGLVTDERVIEAAAEVGVLLLLFTIGIEFSLEKLARIQRLIFVGGGLQVALATGLVAGTLALLGVAWPAAVFSGFLVALSSTAIVTKLLADRAETGAPQGQAAVGALIFQDLAVIVMVLLVPALAGQGGSPLEVAGALGKAALLIALVLVVARRVMPPVLEAVARTCSPELFLLTVIALCFGTAYAVGLAGVSISLGAFLAGLVVSESRFSEHAFSEILPLQILFSATFFVSVGLLLDVGYMVRSLPLVLAVVGAVLAIKLLTAAAAVRAVAPAPVAGAAALLLAQVGEFSFVLERAGAAVGLSPMGMGEAGSQAFIAATVLLMALTPVLAPLAGRLARRDAPGPSGPGTDEAEAFAEAHAALAGHAIVAGYGPTARALVPALAAAGVPFAVGTLSPGGAREAEAAGWPVLRGDYTKRHILTALGLERARVLVLPDDGPAMAHRTTAVARALSPGTPVVALTATGADAAALAEGGAARVVAAEVEAAAALLADVLARYGAADPEAHLAALRARALAAPHSDAPPAGAVTLAPDPEAACTHLDGLRPVVPRAAGCEGCLRTGDRWVHLRVCMTCGHVGCCDSSPNRHATAHFHEAGHPIVRSLEAGETWGWCYADEVRL